MTRECRPSSSSEARTLLQNQTRHDAQQLQLQAGRQILRHRLLRMVVAIKRTHPRDARLRLIGQQGVGAAVEMVFMTKISVNDSERRGLELYAMFFIAAYARVLWAAG